MGTKQFTLFLALLVTLFGAFASAEIQKFSDFNHFGPTRVMFDFRHFQADGIDARNLFSAWGVTLSNDGASFPQVKVRKLQNPVVPEPFIFFPVPAILNGVAYNENGKSIAGMGCDFRDFDNDGKPDIFVVAMVGDMWPLFRNRGRDFQDITSSSGVARAAASFTAWGAGMFDFDNDGWKDLFASRASILDNAEEIDHLPSKLPNSLLRNLGGKRFADVSAAAGPDFQVAQRHRGAAFGDLNNDGLVDIVVTAQHVAPEIYLNRTAKPGHWLLVELTGTKSNRDGLGARLELTAGGMTQYNQATTSVGYSTSSDRRVHFGLGAAATIDKLDVIWPSGTRQTLRNIKPDQLLKLREP